MDNISVIQARPYVIVEPNKMEFTIEGGTQTATIVETSLRDITARVASPDISVTMDGDIITVTATKNTDESSRYDWVILEGTSPEGLQVSYHAIEITQEGSGEDPGPGEVDFSLLLEAGVPIHFGDNPPLIEGTYEMAPVELLDYTEGQWSSGDDDEDEEDRLVSVIFTFLDQTAGSITVQMTGITESGYSGDDEVALAGNIIGNGIGFTIYQIVDVQGDVFFENVKTNMMFITGEVQDGNLKDLWFGTCLSVEDDDGDVYNYIISVRDEDGISTPIDRSTFQGRPQVPDKVKSLMAKQIKKMTRSLSKRMGKQ